MNFEFQDLLNTTYNFNPFPQYPNFLKYPTDIRMVIYGCAHLSRLCSRS